MEPRSLYRRWLVWLGDPETRQRRPERPLSARTLRRLVKDSARHGVLASVTRKLGELARNEPAQAIRAGSASDAGQTLAEILEEGRDRVAAGIGLSELLRATETGLRTALRERGIGFFILKGTTFADGLYDNPALRAFTDIDILVPFDAMEATRAAMKEAGFSPAGSPVTKYKGEYAEEKWIYPRLGGLLVEVHWDLVGSPRARRAVTLTYEELLPFAGGADGTPSLPGLLLVAALHGVAGHGFESLQQVVDVGQAARRVMRTAPSGLAIACADPRWRWTLQVASLTAARVLADEHCERLAAELGAGSAAHSLAGMLGSAAILESGGERHGRYSWRRQLYREGFIRLAPRA